MVVVICMMSYSDPLLKITSPVRGTVAVIALKQSVLSQPVYAIANKLQKKVGLKYLKSTYSDPFIRRSE
ncbi:hypothetical protein GQT90_000950 [Salmonella enterica]|uniref:Uncharacterized protein n=1 Tax=Salmonella enterica TaxID=28901 RepID=A0A633VW64_SALER|nr:hypothetical protein [Salmonella enterica]EAQ4369017.1 hypothetical protein [Salmonella enterica subsp. enterica]EAW4017684.1 hypothetical protein [Salmonella enterica subsp. enterica serovar Hartford]EAM7661753.1 hypothetical protein [Salmonella enterica]EAO4707229.1 hypothetical protein [Salmonella enterica]